MASLDDIRRLSQILSAKHTHAYTSTEQKRKQKENTRLAPLPQSYAEAAARDLGSKVLPKKRKRPARAEKENTTTNLHLLLRRLPPRMAKGHVVRHAVLFRALEPILGVSSGTYLTENWITPHVNFFQKVTKER